MSETESARDMMVRLHGMLIAVERGQLEPASARRMVGNIIHKMDGWEPMKLNDIMAMDAKPVAIRTPSGHLVTNIKKEEGWIYSATIDGQPGKQLGGMDILYVGEAEMEFDVI
jgi:hypothetical protein